MFGNLLNDSTSTIYPVEMARVKAAELAADDPDWSYVVVVNPSDSSKAMIEVRDEDGEFVGRI